jgi:Asp/Glu/hydantoin racemase
VLIIKGGANICGASIGVLSLESYFPKPPGHIKNPSGLSFPVLYAIVEGVTVKKLIEQPSEEMLEPFIAAARHLESEGVRAITGSCGFLALFQKELASAVNIPVFASSLIQIPMIHNMLGAGKQVGVLTADSRGLTSRHYEAVGASHIPVRVAGMESYPEFNEVILQGQRHDMDIALIESEILSSAQALVSDHENIGAIVLECTDMPPYAHRIQQEIGLPVFDLTTLATMVHIAVIRMPYQGIMP